MRSLVRSSLSSATLDNQYAALSGLARRCIELQLDPRPHVETYYPPLIPSATSIPPGCEAEVLAGGAATQTYVSGSQGHQPQIVVGVPIPSVARRLLRGLLAVRPRPHPAGAQHHPPRTGAVTTLLGTPSGASPAAARCAPWPRCRGRPWPSPGPARHPPGPDAADPDLEGLTTSFNTMVDQLQTRIEREARFNSDVSHELRSPLTTLAASLEVLETDHETCPRGPNGPCNSWATTCDGSNGWSATCSRCPGPTPARSTSSSKRSTWGELVRAGGRSRRTHLGDGAPTPDRGHRARARSMSGWTNGGSNGS